MNIYTYKQHEIIVDDNFNYTLILVHFTHAKTDLSHTAVINVYNSQVTQNHSDIFDGADPLDELNEGHYITNKITFKHHTRYITYEGHIVISVVRNQS